MRKYNEEQNGAITDYLRLLMTGYEKDLKGKEGVNDKEIEIYGTFASKMLMANLML